MPDDQSVFDAIAARGTAIVDRAIDWCAVNSGSRNLEGLRRMSTMLEPVLKAFPGSCEVISLEPVSSVADTGEIRLDPLGQALRLTVRREAIRQECSYWRCRHRVRDP